MDTANSNSVNYKPTEVNANKATGISYTPQGVEGNLYCGDSKENNK